MMVLLNSPRMVILDDRPAGQPLLGFDRYRDELMAMILQPGGALQTPLTVGILGSWGSGKTTLMNALDQSFQASRLATVWFDAWRYNQEDQLWAAFLQSILNQAGQNLPFKDRIRFEIRLFAQRINRQKLPLLVLETLVRVLVVVLPILLAWPWVQQTWAAINQTAMRLAGGTLAVGLSWWAGVKPMWEAVRKDVKINFDPVRKNSDYEKHIAFLDQFKDHFNDVVQSLPANAGIHLVIFIDDLDRCAPDKVLQVLDAIKLFTDVPGCLFFIGLDEAVVSQSIKSKYQNDGLAQQNYLDKIIQLTFRLPAISKDQVLGFINALVPEADALIPHPGWKRIFAAGLPANPRQIKRAINLYFFAYRSFFTQRDANVLNHPDGDALRLAKLVALQRRFPTLYAAVRAQPGLLGELETYGRLKQASQLDDVALPLRDVLDCLDPRQLTLLDYHLTQTNPGAAGPQPTGLTPLARIERQVNRLSQPGIEELFQWGRANFPDLPWLPAKNKIDQNWAAGRYALPAPLGDFIAEQDLREIINLYNDDPAACFSAVGADDIRRDYLDPLGQVTVVERPAAA